MSLRASGVCAGNSDRVCAEDSDRVVWCGVVAWCDMHGVCAEGYCVSNSVSVSVSVAVAVSVSFRRGCFVCVWRRVQQVMCDGMSPEANCAATLPGPRLLCLHANGAKALWQAKRVTRQKVGSEWWREREEGTMRERRHWKGWAKKDSERCRQREGGVG